MKKGLFYCQHFVGLGHVVRSLNLCRSLTKVFEIDFLCEVQEPQLSLNSPHFHLHPLSPINPLAFQPRIHEWKELQSPYSFLIIELFPFSKWILKEEIEQLIHWVKKRAKDCLVVCSLRDSFPPLPPEQEILVRDFILTYFDSIFVHADPKVYQLEESFAQTQTFKEKIHYTGFIVNPDIPLNSKRRKKQIVVSNGAGSFGNELLIAVSAILPFFKEYQFFYVLGPKTPFEIKARLEATQLANGNLAFYPFSDQFLALMHESALSINLGGYTIIDAISSQTSALVYPTYFLDQYIRAIKFSAFEQIHILTQEELGEKHLAEAISQMLILPPSFLPIDWQGAPTSCALLEKKLGE